jgi:four helix bundle protein
MVSNFKDLIAWKKSIELTKEVYSLCSKLPKSEDYVLASQLKRAANSISANIAEGSSKRSTKEFIRFLSMSYGSLAELESHFLSAKELSFLTENDLDEAVDIIIELGKIINGLMNSLLKKLNSEL